MKNTPINYQPIPSTRFININLIACFFLLLAPLKSYGQTCPFLAPQELVEYNALVDLFNANPNSDLAQDQAWIDLANGVNCDVCALTEVKCRDFGSLSLITELEISFDEITDLTSSIGNLSRLEKFYVYYNQLTSLPTSIGNLTNLEELDAYNNQLTSLPASIDNLTNLQELDVANNQLTTLPASIGNLTNLQRLRVGRNQLISLPTSIGNLSSLQEFDVYYNQLTALPTSIGNLTNLEELDAYNNQLTNLPTSIGNLTNLEKLWAFDNQLTSLPISIGNLSSLKYLHVSSNQLTTLPISILILTNLQDLHVSRNQLTTIPESIGNLTNLQFFSIGANQLTSLPEGIGNLTNLLSLSTYGNQLITIPESIRNLSNLKYLYVDENQLTSLPESIGNLTNLEEFDVELNQLDCLPSELINLCTNNFLDVSFYGNPIASLYPTLDEFCTAAPATETCVGSEPYLTGNDGSEPCTVWVDSDNDGICDDADVCEGGDDYIDNDSNGIPDACDGDSNPNEPYLTGNTGDETCTVWIDSDNDGICDDADICEGGDDYVDNDSNGIPDACDGGSSVIGPYLTGNTGNETCTVWIDSDDDGICDDADICEGGDDYADVDSDGIPDACDTNSSARIAQPERLIAEKVAGRKVKLTWVANEIQSIKAYTIQHSNDGVQYQNLITETPRASGEIGVYYGAHSNPNVGNNFYRLQIDFLEKNSEYYVSEPIYFTPTGIAAFPNPTKDVLHVNLSEIMGTSVRLKLFTMQGVELKTIEIDAHHDEVVELDMRSYNNGIYTLNIKPDGFKAISQKVVISNTD